MNKKKTSEDSFDREKVHEMLTAIWPELQRLTPNEEGSGGAPEASEKTTSLNEDDLGELLNAIDPIDKEEVLSTEEVEQILNALAEGTELPPQEQDVSQEQKKPSYTREETELLLKTIGAMKQAEAQSSGDEHHSPLSEDEVEKLIQALSQND